MPELIYSEVTVPAAPWYSLSFSGAILEEVVRCCLSVFILVLHNIILGVSKPLNSHEKVSDRIWLSSLLDKESAAINLGGTTFCRRTRSKKHHLAVMIPFQVLLIETTKNQWKKEKWIRLFYISNRLVYPSLPIIIMWLSFQKSSSWIYFAFILSHTFFFMFLEHQNNINFTRRLKIGFVKTWIQKCTTTACEYD